MERTPEQQELYSLLAEQALQLHLIQEEQLKMKNRLTWMLVGDYFRIALVVIPIIIGIMFLAPFAKTVADQFSRLSPTPGNNGVSIDMLLKTLSK